MLSCPVEVQSERDLRSRFPIFPHIGSISMMNLVLRADTELAAMS
jgi:hypothetical protein